jgi:hypothetical protein
MLSCHHDIAFDPQGYFIVKQRDADLEPRVVQRKFFKLGVGNLVMFPKDY